MRRYSVLNCLVIKGGTFSRRAQDGQRSRRGFGCGRNRIRFQLELFYVSLGTDVDEQTK